ncbi:MAG: hypothetical protein OXC98_08305 [bacterium]|nr:hypothetical protein [bacterium]
MTGYLYTYLAHDKDDPSVHVKVIVPPCGTDHPDPTGDTCPTGYHYHAVPGECHPDHVVPSCNPHPRAVIYTVHLPQHSPDDHATRAAARCPIPTTTTTTAPTTTTTTTAAVSGLTCGAIPQSQLDLVKSVYGWDSAFNYPSTVKKGTALPQGGGTNSLFITSDKINSPGAAEPQIWPVYPSTPSLVTDGGGCVWEAMEVRSVWKELKMWNAADRLLIGRVKPTFITRWDRLSTVQKDILRNGHHHLKRGIPDTLGAHNSDTLGDCPMNTLDPRGDCAFSLPHPGVYAWQLQVRFETDSGGTTEESWETLHSGTSYLVRFIDYADWQSTISG